MQPMARSQNRVKQPIMKFYCSNEIKIYATHTLVLPVEIISLLILGSWRNLE